MNPVILEVISVVPGLYKFCSPCELAFQRAGLTHQRDQDDLNEYPEDLKEEYLHLSHWIKEIHEKYQDEISIRVIAAQSFQGFYKSIRHRAFRYPTFIINGKKAYSGKDKSSLDALIRQQYSVS
jgi:hypothetical protein